MEVSEICLTCLLGVLTGVVASYIFLHVYLLNKRPNVKIADYIYEEHTDKGEIRYWFKIVNQSNRDIMDVKIEPTFYQPFADKTGSNLRRISIPVRTPVLNYVPGKNKKDSHNLHCIRILSEIDLKSEWKTDSFIRLTIIAKHSMSGFHKVFTMDFDSLDKIRTRKFESGDI